MVMDANAISILKKKKIYIYIYIYAKNVFLIFIIWI